MSRSEGSRQRTQRLNFDISNGTIWSGLTQGTDCIDVGNDELSQHGGNRCLDCSNCCSISGTEHVYQRFLFLSVGELR